MKPSAPLTSLSRSVPRDPSVPTSLIEGTCLLKLGPAEGFFLFFFYWKTHLELLTADRSFGRWRRRRRQADTESVGRLTSGAGNQRPIKKNRTNSAETFTETHSRRGGAVTFPARSAPQRTFFFKFSPANSITRERNDNDDSQAERFGGRR